MGWQSRLPRKNTLVSEDKEFLDYLRELNRRTVQEEDALVERLRNLDLNPIGPEKTRLIRELLSLARIVLVREKEVQTPYEEKSCFLHPEIQPRVREIGERLWEITRDDDPDFLNWFANCDLLSIPRCFHSELYIAWEGLFGIVL